MHDFSWLQADAEEYGIEAGWVEGTPLPTASKSIGAHAAAVF